MKYRIGFKFDTGKIHIEDYGDHFQKWEVARCMRQTVLEFFNWEWHRKHFGLVIEVLVKIDKDIWKWKNGKWEKKR